MFYKIDEGEQLRNGFNYTRTMNGHRIVLVIQLFNTRRIMIGYYWGKRFTPYFSTWNQKEQDIITARFTRE